MSALPASEHDRPSTPGTWLMAAVALLIGFLITSGYGRAMGELAFVAFKQIARAQYELHQASQNLNADGQAEFAVLMKSNTAERDLKAFLATRDGWDARPASIPGWAVIAAPATASGVINELRSQPFTKAVLRNRGVWICH